MSDWPTVKWTSARQVADAMELDEESWPPAEIKPRDHFLQLREKGELDEAALFLGHALPRLEAVAWAAFLLDQRSKRVKLSRRDRQALDRSLRWLEEPVDEYRRSAFEAAQAAGAKSPERLLGMAVFASGGSLAPPEFPAIPPPQNACGGIAASAVLAGVADSDDRELALREALDLGDRIAAEGVKVLAQR